MKKDDFWKNIPNNKKRYILLAIVATALIYPGYQLVNHYLSDRTSYTTLTFFKTDTNIITKAEAIEMITRVYLDKEAWTDEKNETTEAKQLVFRASDGTVGYTKAFLDAVIAELIKAGVDVAWANDIINDYFEVMEGKDNSSINMEVLGQLIFRVKNTIIHIFSMMMKVSQ